MHEKLANLTEKDIENIFDPVIRQRGYEYFEEGAVINEVAFENRIMATVIGTMDYITSVEVVDGELHFSCSCLYDGLCKHEAALLYAWVKRRNEFIDMEKIIEDLRKMDKEEIISFIRDAICLNPNNFLFLAPLDENAIKKKIDNMFMFGYPYSGDIATELKNLLPRIKRSEKILFHTGIPSFLK